MAIPDKAITRNEQYLSAMAGQSGRLPDAPITRKERYLAKAAGQDVETPEPITREEMYLDVIAEGGGGGEAVLINKTVTANGTYLPAADSADGYKKVVVNVPTPTPTLTPKTITENGVYLPQDDGADGYDTVTVDVPTPSGVFEMFGTTPDIEGATSIQIQNVGGLNMASVICGFLVFTDISTNDVLESDVPPNGPIRSFVIGTHQSNDYLGRIAVSTSANFYCYNNGQIIGDYYSNGTTITLNNGVLTCSCNRGPRILPNRPFRLLIWALT